MKERRPDSSMPSVHCDFKPTRLQVERSTSTRSSVASHMPPPSDAKKPNSRFRVLTDIPSISLTTSKHWGSRSGCEEEGEAVPDSSLPGIRKTGSEMKPIETELRTLVQLDEPVDQSFLWLRVETFDNRGNRTLFWQPLFGSTAPEKQAEVNRKLESKFQDRGSTV